MNEAIYAAVLNAGAAGFTASAAFSLALLGHPWAMAFILALTGVNLALLRFNLSRARMLARRNG